MLAEFFRPANLTEALKLLSQYNDSAVVVNGGSDIIISISQKKIVPKAIVSIGHLKELKEINTFNDYISIGGAVTYMQIEESPECQRLSGLMKAISHLASTPVRAIATPAGNIGTAAPAADCATMLMALRAQIVLKSIEEERIMPMEKIFSGKNRTEIRSDELISEIRIPKLHTGDGTGYCRVSRRKAQDIGKILVGAFVNLSGDIITDAAISLGALNANIVRAYSLEQQLIGMNIENAEEYLKKTFPEEAGLRNSYFRDYKEKVTSAITARAFSRALSDSRERSVER